MHPLQAIFLGLIQGITEFLPVSSSAHLVLAPWIFGWKDPGLAFDVFLHLGTLLALILYFWSDWWAIGTAGIASILERRIGFERDRRMFWLILVGTIPAGLAGYALHDYVEDTLRSPLIIAISLSSVGFLLYWVDGRASALRGLDELSWSDSIWIGLAQAAALVPGVSRSGATMTMARFLGFNREIAARFSFLLSLPIIVAACAFELRGLLDDGTMPLSWGYLLGGFLASAISGMLAIHFLIYYLKAADFRVFAWYRIAVAGVVVIASLAMGR